MASMWSSIRFPAKPWLAAWNCLRRTAGSSRSASRTSIRTATWTGPFQRAISYFAIDLDRMFRERPEEIHELLVEIAAWFEPGN